MTQITIFSSKSYDKDHFLKFAPQFGFKPADFQFLETHLSPQTANLAANSQAVCAFVNDDLSEKTLEALSNLGVKMVALRCAGFNQVDLNTAKQLGMTVARVPEYSPYAVAEHALALILTLNRKTHRAFNRVREGNFSLEGLVGFDLHGKTVGLIGTGKIGQITAQILLGLGCKVLAYDVAENPACKAMGVEFISLETLYAESDIISLHCPLLPATHHIINKEAIAQMKTGVMIINTSRGGLVDSKAVIKGLKNGKIGYLGLDVYEEEGPLFFEDFSGQVIQDDDLMRLMSFPNVLVTSHQAFLTQEALNNIAQTTLGNIQNYLSGQKIDTNNLVG